MSPVFLIFYILTSISLFLYSYGFVDFNLTLSSHPAIMSFVAWTQSLAMFDRPLSTIVYLTLVFVIFTLYIFTLRHYKISKLTRFPWKLIVILALILTLAYPFLSHDVFKYLFAGRMVVDYGLNPHITPPNHVVGDDWLRFLRWVHTPSPYGPFMTVLAVIYYILGMGKFVPTLYLFKLDQVAWYLLSTFLVGKLAHKLGQSKSRSILAQLIFALNPLILIEWLVNAHNDAPMISLMLLSFYLLTQKKKLSSFFALLLSVSIKYITVLFLPIIFLKKKYQAKPYILYTTYYLLLTLTLAPLFYKYSFQYQPWYVTWLIPLVAILPISPLTYIIISYSLGSLLRYLPFIRTGLWGATPVQFALYSFAPPALTAITIFLTRRLRRL